MLIVISAVAESPWAVEDCSLAAENLMLAASAAGLGTCCIGFAQSLAWNAGRKSGAETVGNLRAGRSHYRGPSKISGTGGSKKDPDCQLDFVDDRLWRAKARVVHSVAFLTRAVTKADFPLANLSFNLPWTVS